MLNLDSIKKNYQQPENFTYLNTSSTGLVSLSGINKAAAFNEQLLKFGSKHVEKYYLKEIPLVRKVISEFIEASFDEIAFIPNFSYGLNAVIPAIAPLKRVLLYKDDYPSLTLPFELNGFEIFWIESRDGFYIDLEQLKEKVIKSKIEIVAISHVQYLTGFTIDIDELGLFCKANDILLVVDGTQSLGALPFSFRNSGVNILATSSYKWINGGFGTGFMCIDQKTLEKYPAKIGGFNSLKYVERNWEYLSSIHSYEPGHHNMAGLAMLKDAIEFKLKIGVENIFNHNLMLSSRLIKKAKLSSFKLVGPSNPINRTNMVGIRGDKQLEKHLSEQNIIVKMRNNIIRVGIHFYNSIEDIDRFTKCLESYYSLKNPTD